MEFPRENTHGTQKSGDSLSYHNTLVFLSEADNGLPLVVQLCDALTIT